MATTDCSSLPKDPVGAVMIDKFCEFLFKPGADQATLCSAIQQTNCSNISGLGSCSINPLRGSWNQFDTGNYALLPGPYTFQTDTATGPGTDTEVLAEGDIKTFTFQLPAFGTVPSQFTTNLTFADPRELPDAAIATITGNNVEDCAERNYSVPHSASGMVTLKAFQYSQCQYSLNVSGRSQPLLQTADNNITLHRIDVDDVTVTREDGTTFTTPGTYQLYFQGKAIAGPYATNSGIDVLPGTYQLTVNYTTATGAQSNQYALTF
jgi:hypothetical protein